jgi:hypothetical protein
MRGKAFGVDEKIEVRRFGKVAIPTPKRVFPIEPQAEPSGFKDQPDRPLNRKP